EWLMAGGVMALVCPEDLVAEHSHARQHLARHYEQNRVVPFPEEHRPFNEVVVFGHKRDRPEADRTGTLSSWDAVQAPKGFRYQIPSGAGPRRFEKTEPTEPELQRMLASSPLRSRLIAPPEATVPSPPLPLGIGHVALLL